MLGAAKSLETKHIYQVRDVFRTTGVPTVTFVERQNAALDELKFKLDGRGLVNVHGDSRSGKTVLALKLLERRKPIVLYGPHIRSTDNFWRALARHLAVPNDVTITTQREDEEKIKAGISVALPGLSAKLGAERGRVRSVEMEESYSTDSHGIIEKLIEVQRPLVIDDFHSVDKDVQDAIVAQLKPALDHAETVVFVSVPEQTGDIISRLNSSGALKGGEIKARSTEHENPLWTPEEIKEIATKGFDALNLQIDEDTLDRLARNAYRNPLLMQWYCQRLCHVLRIGQTLDVGQRITVAGSKVDEILRYIASEYEETYNNYLHVRDDGGRRWQIKSGKRVNIYLFVLIALAGMPINKPLKPRTLRDRMKTHIDREANLPSSSDIANALAGLVQRMQGKEDYEAPLRYDPEKGHAYVTHPFFKVFLQWKVLPEFQ